MIEFGSNFHYITSFLKSGNEFIRENKLFFANGRQTLQYLIRYNYWKRIWIPAYFCYEIVEFITNMGIEIAFYDDFPLNSDNDSITEIDFENGDVLLRMNYFGLRRFRNNSQIHVPVIEDHSHDLLGEWAQRSNADWCIASLRKTLPIADGGVLWSPKNHTFLENTKTLVQNEYNAYKRFSAMLLKSLYLNGENISKENYIKLYLETEDNFSNLSICDISECSKSILNNFDIEGFYERKKDNWKFLFSELNTKVKILETEDIDFCNPFSIILRFQNKSQRENIRRKLIENKIFPAVLWNIPNYESKEIRHLSDILLSVHCDARYGQVAIEYLKNQIAKILDT